MGKRLKEWYKEGAAWSPKTDEGSGGRGVALRDFVFGGPEPLARVAALLLSSAVSRVFCWCCSAYTRFPRHTNVCLVAPTIFVQICTWLS